jgi:hypothetical protein
MYRLSSQGGRPGLGTARTCRPRGGVGVAGAHPMTGGKVIDHACIAPGHASQGSILESRRGLGEVRGGCGGGGLGGGGGATEGSRASSNPRKACSPPPG